MRRFVSVAFFLGVLLIAVYSIVAFGPEPGSIPPAQQQSLVPQ